MMNAFLLIRVVASLTPYIATPFINKYDRVAFNANTNSVITYAFTPVAVSYYQLRY